MAPEQRRRLAVRRGPGQLTRTGLCRLGHLPLSVRY
jgi:hypothetical protein